MALSASFKDFMKAPPEVGSVCWFLLAVPFADGREWMALL
jgi:hypothetical protein